MRSFHRKPDTFLFAAWVAALLIGCSGGTPAAENPDNPPPLDDQGETGPVAAASSEKVKQGRDLIQQKDFAGAKAVLSAAVKDSPEDAQAAFYLGVAHESLAEAEPAIEMYRKALSLDAKLLEAAVNLSALLLDAQDAKGALEAANQGLKVDGKHAGLLMNRALALEAVGEKDEAVKAYAAAVEAAPDNVELRYAFAEVLAAGGRTDQALEELRKISSDDPKVVAAVATQFGKLKAFSDCVGALDKVIKAKPMPDLHVRRGVCRHELNDDAGAKADYDAALKLDPNFAAAHYYLGMHYKNKGDKKAALASLEKAAQLAGDSSLGKLAKKELEELKGGAKKK
jgi:tetratricopeptide (TPR) repeat protein